MALTKQYAAGFFDGEGSVYSASRRGHRTIVVCVSQVNVRVLRMLQRQYGGAVNARGGKHAAAVRAGHRQQQHQWVLCAKAARPFLEAIQPYVVVKKKVVAAALNCCRIAQDTSRAKRVVAKVVFRRGRNWVSHQLRAPYALRLSAAHAKVDVLNQAAAPFNSRRQR